MKVFLTSSIPAARQNRMVAVSPVKRTTAVGSRVLTPVPAAGEVLLVGLVMLLGLFLSFATNPAHAAMPKEVGSTITVRYCRHSVAAVESHAEANRLPTFSPPIAFPLLSFPSPGNYR
jgi:hypothetical protein